MTHRQNLPNIYIYRLFTIIHCYHKYHCYSLLSFLSLPFIIFLNYHYDSLLWLFGAYRRPRDAIFRCRTNMIHATYKTKPEQIILSFLPQDTQCGVILSFRTWTPNSRRLKMRRLNVRSLWPAIFKGNLKCWISTLCELARCSQWL